MDKERAVSGLSLVDELLFKLLKPVKILVVDPAHGTEELAPKLKMQFECEVASAQPGALPKLEDYDLVLVDMKHADAVPVTTACQKAGVRSVLLVDDVDSPEVMAAARQSAVVVAHKPVSELDFYRLFQLFRLRVLEKQDTAYFESRQHQHHYAPG